MFQIPENQLPDCLKDEKRTDVLFAPLRSNNVNPKDWENKLCSWKLIIKTFCECNNVYTFSFADLCNVFIRNGRSPCCLREVIDDMLKNGEILSTETIMKQNINTWSGWAINALYWPINKIRDTFLLNNSTQFVHKDFLECQSKKMLNILQEKDKLISLREISLLFEQNSLEPTVIKLIVYYLKSKGKLDLAYFHFNKEELDCCLVKINNGSKFTPISETDIGTYTLEQNEKIMSKAIEMLNDEVDKCVTEAKLQLSKKHKNLAKIALRKKHELEKRLNKKLNTLQNIQILLDRINDLHSDKTIWETYKKALDAFNTTFKDSDMSENAIEDSMVKLSELLEEHNDMQQILGKPIIEDFINDQDLEEELEELLINNPINKPPPENKPDNKGANISDLENELDALCLNLPEVPANSPDISTQELTTN